MSADTRNIVVFDGVCNLCTHSVAFILAHERDQAIRFAAAQSAAGQKLLREFGIASQDMVSVVYVKGDTAYLRSDAALAIAGHLRMPWRMLRILLIVPRWLRDLAYDLLARDRYRWFGQHDTCPMPSPELRSRFVES